ncbi:MAG: hypothetical protein A2X50_11820 [Candidatus Rokubacteria bacterium GWF2_70_14]|nr:MAG: hypothetical protein A2X50_11820 [Candidatus Rokubacteria bacterium GWF2_70_14]
MAFLFDTEAISEVLKPLPLPAYVAWLRAIPRAEQFTSAVVVGERCSVARFQIQGAPSLRMTRLRSRAPAPRSALAFPASMRENRGASAVARTPSHRTTT